VVQILSDAPGMLGEQLWARIQSWIEGGL
jgi:hypothetical protein